MDSRLDGKLICKPCLERDAVVSGVVVEHRCTNPHTGKQFDAYVCKRCLDEGRETRVTCRTFSKVRRFSPNDS